MTTEDSEVDSLPILKGAHGQRSAHPNCRAFGHLSQIFRQGEFRLVHAVSESPLPCDLDDFELEPPLRAQSGGYITHAASPPINEPHAKPRSKSRDQWPTRRHGLRYTTSINSRFPSSRSGGARLCRHRDCKARVYQRQSPHDNRALAVHGLIALQIHIRAFIVFHSVVL